jgi:predicted DsbA family dithiol-disulfide isomerase
VRVDIWSDVVCPWCYLGKRRLEKALASFEHADELEIHWRAFELDPGAAPVRGGDPVEGLARKYRMTRDQAQAAHDRLTGLAAAEGLEYHLDRTRGGNTFDAHRLIQLASDQGRGGVMKERLCAAYFSEGRAIGDHDVLQELAVEVGLDAEEARLVLAGDAWAARVRADEAEAVERQITGVPYFLLDGRFAVPGAQDAETMLTVLRRAWERGQAA